MDRTEKELEIIQTYLNFVNRLPLETKEQRLAVFKKMIDEHIRINDESYDSSKLEDEFKSV
jgi:hypothetical protein